MKRVVKIRQKPQVDLRNFSGKSERVEGSLCGKQLIVEVMDQLISHTTQQVNSLSGEDKKRHQFRLTQFKKALNSIKSYEGEINSGEEARKLNGVGKGIADRIEEIIRTGTLKELSQTIEIDAKTSLINELTSVTGIGESNAKKFIEQGVTSLADLRRKVEQKTIKITHHMQVGLKYFDEFQQRIPYQEMSDLETTLKEIISGLYPDIMVVVCGSYRRKRPSSGDIDVLITHPDIKTDDDLINSNVKYLKNIVGGLKSKKFLIDDLTTQGDTKYMGVCVHPNVSIGRRIDIRFVTFESFYPALLYFTGSMMFNKLSRTVALEKGYTLNEYGIYKFVRGSKEERIVVSSEKEIFDILGLVYLEPDQREIC